MHLSKVIERPGTQTCVLGEVVVLAVEIDKFYLHEKFLYEIIVLYYCIHL